MVREVEELIQTTLLRGIVQSTAWKCIIVEKCCLVYMVISLKYANFNMVEYCGILHIENVEKFVKGKKLEWE